MTTRIWTIISISLVLVFGAGFAGAQEADEAALNVWLEAHIAADGPGAAVIAVRNGKTILRAGYGLADIENSLPVSADSVFRLGSISKQFAAAAIMLLAEDGKLSVTDPITKFLPDYPTHGHDITLHHLLTHTSGLRNYTDVPGWYKNYSKMPLTTEELIASFSAEEMDFAPGARYNYSNSGYVLLGAIIEAVTDGGYEDFIQARLFDPLALDQTYYGGHVKLIPKRVRGYSVDPDGGFVNADFIDMAVPHAAGALLSTVDDLAVWFAALSSGRVVSAESYAAMTAKTTLNDGETSDYGYGLYAQTLKGRASVAHSGGINGFSTSALYLPGEGLYVAALRNVGGGSPDPGFIVQSIAAMVIGDPFSERVAIDLDGQQKARHIGTYKAESGADIRVLIEDGELFIDGALGRRQALAASPDVYFFDNSFWRLEFHAGEDGAADYLDFFTTEEGEPAVTASKVEEPAASDE